MGRVFITALIFMSGWISFSVCEFYTVAALPGEDVTLQCLNFTRVPSHIAWFRLNHTSEVRAISSLDNADGSAHIFEEFQNSSFSMTSNSTHLFLRIKSVDFCDSGLYFCGNQSGGKGFIVSATYLEVRVFMSAVDGNSPVNMILGVLIALLSIIIITLVFMIRKLHTAPKEEQNPQPSQAEGCEDVNYAALRFPLSSDSRRKNETENKELTYVVYTATRNKKDLIYPHPSVIYSTSAFLVMKAGAYPSCPWIKRRGTP